MEFSTKLGSDLELLITRTEFDKEQMLKKLAIYKKRKRITNEEYEYLKKLVETESAKQD